MNDPQQANVYNSFLVAAIETGEGARIIHDLGGNLDEAARIMAMSPMRMAVELTKLSMRQAAPTTSAPRPIRPVGNNRSHNAGINPDDPDRSDGLSTAEWMRRREQMIIDREGGGGRRRQ
jgi:hypothetical protein